MWYWHVFEVAINFFQAWLFAYFVEMIFPPAQRFEMRMPWLRLLVICLGGAWLSAYSFFEIAFPPDNIPLIFTAVAYSLFRSGKWYYKGMAAAVAITIDACNAYACIGLFGIFFPREAIFSFSEGRFIVVTTVMLFLFFEFWALGHFLNKRWKTSAAGAWPTIVLGASLLLYCAFLVLLGHYAKFVTDDMVHPGWMAAAALGMLLLSMFILWVFNVIEKQSAKVAQMEMEAQHSKLQAEHHLEIKNMYEEMRSWRHDHHNHLQTMKWLHASGEYAELGEYLDSCTSATETSSKLYAATGFSFLDALVSAKAARAHAEGIECTVQIQPLESLPIPEVEFCALLGNLMDNAIEANLYLKEGARRFVTLTIAALNMQLHIQVANATDGVETIRDGTLLSRKTGKPGIGLRNIDRITARHGGFVQRAKGPERYQCDVLLPYDEQNTPPAKERVS